jgi:hypothetical protein
MRWSATALLSITNVLMFLRIGQHLKRLSRDAAPIATSLQSNQ